MGGGRGGEVERVVRVLGEELERPAGGDKVPLHFVDWKRKG